MDMSSVAPQAVTHADVEDAARLIAGHVRETPMVSAGELGRRVGARVLKAENFQLTGSFKARGATNTIRRLSDEALEAGVVAPSGNRATARAVAFAARQAGARSVLVMPEEAPLAKVAAVRRYEAVRSCPAATTRPAPRPGGWPRKTG